jgi:hypothetical protein
MGRSALSDFIKDAQTTRRPDGKAIVENDAWLEATKNQVLIPES